MRMVKKEVLNQEYQDFLDMHMNTYLELADRALKDGAITQGEYDNFKKAVELANEDPSVADNEKELKEKVDLARFDSVMSKLDKYFKPAK